MAEVSLEKYSEPCDIARQMGISIEFAVKVIVMADFFRAITGHSIEMISGYRSCAQQEALGRAGRPAAPCDVSTHTACPATGGDFRLPGLSDTDFLKMQFGSAALRAGLRWGGGSPERDVVVLGRVIGRIPSDWNHLDLGRRVQ